MNITSQQVHELREKSGAGIMDCKRALTDAGGDCEKAIKILREKGKASAAQKAGRSTGQGLVCCWISPEGKKGSVVEINCETDFVARTKDFQDLARQLARHTGEKSVQDAQSLLAQTLGSSETVESVIKEKIAKLGENIKLKKAAIVGGNGSESIVGNYVHAPLEGAPECGTLVVLVELVSGKSGDEVKELMKELCMQVAAALPKWISKDDVPAEIVAKEKEIYMEQCRQSGKPEKAWNKILEGKLADFFRQFCLLEQPHIRDSSRKTFVKSLIQAVAEKTGSDLTVKRFVRVKLGEE